jgi:uncharacterized protein (TIGR03083 family)
MSHPPQTASSRPVVPPQHRTPEHRTLRPRTLLLRTVGGCDLDPEHLLEVLGEQRRRFTAVLQGFGPDDWAAATRCSAWSAQEVVRHLCDGNAIGIAVEPDDGTLDNAEGFDPRTTPGKWLATSVGESPDDTLRRFVASTGQLLAAARDRLARGIAFDVRMPYGPMDWTVLMLHAFWDSWIHERDVLLARGAEHPGDDDAAAYATAYGVFIAAAVASMFGDQVQEKLMLDGPGGGLFQVDTSRGVTLTVSRGSAAGPPAVAVADALAGRSSAGAVLSDLPVSSRTALSHLGELFNTPAEQRPIRNAGH